MPPAGLGEPQSAQKRLRVLHAPWNIGGHPGQISRAERELGLDSHAVTLKENAYAFPIDEVLTAPGASAYAVERARIRLLRRALRDFDLVHFNFGQSILESETAPDPLGGFRHSAGRGLWQLYARAVWMADLPVLRAYGKGMAVTFQGDDARQGDASRTRDANSVAHQVGPNYYTSRGDAWKRKVIARFARYSDLIYALNPDLLHVLPPRAQFLPYGNLDPREWPEIGLAGGDTLSIVHAPTHRGVKGTEFVVQVVEKLRAEGRKVELSIIEGHSVEAARALYRRADLLIDQLLIGWYGGLAVEFMALGKPVLAYLRREDLHFIPAEMAAELPIVQATPHSLYTVLKDLLDRPRSELAAIGRRGRSFVERWHDPRRIACRLGRDYQAVMARIAARG
jgi:glycosyltransferase involved in cell wall biosynthesis